MTSLLVRAEVVVAVNPRVEGLQVGHQHEVQGEVLIEPLNAATRDCFLALLQSELEWFWPCK